MQKKVLTTFALLLSIVGLGSFPTKQEHLFNCTEPQLPTMTGEKEAHTEKFNRVYQIWCGGIY